MFKAPVETAVLPSPKKEGLGKGTTYHSGCNPSPGRDQRLNDTPNPGPASDPPRSELSLIGLGWTTGIPKALPLLPQLTTGLRRALTDPRSFRRQIERMFDRTILSPARYALRQDGVSLDALFDGQRSISRILAGTLAGDRYEFAPGRIRTIRVNGKSRDVFSFRLTDLIVQGVVTEVIAEATRPLLSPRLYSYRPKVSGFHAVFDFAQFVRRHRKSLTDPRRRGLYVIRRDVDSYTDSIPVDPASPIWNMLFRLLGRTDGRLPSADRRIVEDVIRPLVEWKDGGPVRLIRGVPTGQPISCVLFNFYLHELDRLLEAVPGGFYARYSDDILFAHPDALTVRQAWRTIESELARLGLRLKPEKSLDLFLTPAGRSSDAWPEARGSSAVPFLGTDIEADGTIALDRVKTRSLLRDLADRAGRAARALHGQPPEVIGRTVCAVLNRALCSEAALFRQRSADILRHIVTDRSHLRHLDLLIARIVARVVTGEAGTRAFRTAPPARIRREWGLDSLVQDRNKPIRKTRRPG